MNNHPLNLTLRFLLEIAMLIILGYWGWQKTAGWERWIAGIGLPLIAAALWGIFRIPDDPNPAPVEVPGLLRLLLEWLLFAAAVWALRDLQKEKSALLLATIVILHYIVSYDRTGAMLKNRKYAGFKKKSQ